MFKMNAHAVVCNHVETLEPCLLATAADEEIASALMAQQRATLTQIAALPHLEEADYEKVMASIRSLRIIPVRVTQITQVA